MIYIDSVGIPEARAVSDEGPTAVRKVVVTPHRMFNMNVVRIRVVGAAHWRK
jgi:hypothetical protein